MGFMHLRNYIYLEDCNIFQHQNKEKSFSEQKENITFLKKLVVNNILAQSTTNTTSYVREFNNSMEGYYYKANDEIVHW